MSAEVAGTISAPRPPGRALNGIEARPNVAALPLEELRKLVAASIAAEVKAATSRRDPSAAKRSSGESAAVLGARHLVVAGGVANRWRRPGKALVRLSQLA
jgi:hypothetical protein